MPINLWWGGGRAVVCLFPWWIVNCYFLLRNPPHSTDLQLTITRPWESDKATGKFIQIVSEIRETLF